MEFASFEFVYATAIVLVLVGLASYFGWRQFQALGELAKHPELPAEDRSHHRSQAIRRLVSCGLMFTLAGLLVGSYVAGQERRAEELGVSQTNARTGEIRPENAEVRLFLNHYGVYWIIFSLVLLVWLGLALFDLWAIRRFWWRHYHQIISDRREMIERQVARIRSQRNGH